MTFSGEGSYDGKIRVYIDNSEKPVLEENVLKLLSGQLLAGEPLSSSVSPETETDKRGHNLYLPLPFSKHCRITYECNAIKISGKHESQASITISAIGNMRRIPKLYPFPKTNSKVPEELIKKTNEILMSPEKIKKDRTAL